MMESFIALCIALANKTLVFAVSAISVHYMLKYWDQKNNINWGNNYDAFDESPQALATYFGLRVLAIAWLAASVYG